ncbi:MAG: abortive infection family protein [Pseudolabrys sp.]
MRAQYAGPRMIALSPQTIDALALVISGGGGNDATPPIGLYRSGPKLESFMRSCGVMMSVGAGSRVPTLVSAIIRAVNEGNDEALTTIIERAADPRDFVQEPEKLEKVLRHLNSYLQHDGYELQNHGSNSRLIKRGTSASAITSLAATVATIDFDTVQRDLDRALASAESDPEDAVTAACSVVESVCRSVLCELGLPLPVQLDVKGLYKAVREPLGLSPGKEDVSPEIADDVRAILGGLNAAVQGIGSLRTHAGDAHGRERGFRRLDSRIARLAIHSASGIALFVIETWQKKFPAKPLHAHSQ